MLETMTIRLSPDRMQVIITPDPREDRVILDHMGQTAYIRIQESINPVTFRRVCQELSLPQEAAIPLLITLTVIRSLL